MRIALLEVSHWHLPLYLDALTRPGLKIVGVSERDPEIATCVAARFGCTSYASWETLLQEKKLDFAFVFGRHAEMPHIGAALIEKRVPFAIEKPCGVSAADVAALRAAAENAGLYVAIPFIFRISDMLREVRSAENTLSSRWHHVAFRFIAGPPSRYVKSGSPWMLDPAIAGGGCTINLATHFIDLFRQLTGSEVRTVSAVMSHRAFGEKIEDHSLLMLTANDGTVGAVETGYTFPGNRDEQREFAFSLSSDRGYYRSAPDALLVRERGNAAAETRRVAIRVETDDYYPRFVERALSDCASGRRPVAGLADAEAMMHVVDAAYASARTDGHPVEVGR